MTSLSSRPSTVMYRTVWATNVYAVVTLKYPSVESKLCQDGLPNSLVPRVVQINVAFGSLHSVVKGCALRVRAQLDEQIF